jgi:hypothetical protein
MIIATSFSSWIKNRGDPSALAESSPAKAGLSSHIFTKIKKPPQIDLKKIYPH